LQVREIARRARALDATPRGSEDPSMHHARPIRPASRVFSAGALVLAAWAVCAGCTSLKSTSPASASPATVANSAGVPASADSRSEASIGSARPTALGTPATEHAWAEALELPGVPNLHRVAPTLYRGGQPSAEGFTELAKLGVKTVVSLRAFHGDPAEAYLLAHESISFKYWHPEDEDVVRFLAIATDPARVPVFVHCWHGADRTGMMCAIYRIAVEGWTKDEALREMTAGPFDFHASMAHLARYVRESDIDALARRAGLKPRAP
jgi:protein tyrosine phosphatase (PTP) superfamily phosphohydrolase (DUF442 family)